MNKRTRIIGALILGIGIILGALWLRGETGQKVAEVVSVTDQGIFQRNYLPLNDKNDNGISDWEEELQKMTLEAAKDAPEIDIEGSSKSSTTSVTDTFARSFFENYAKNNASGALTVDNKEAFLKASIGDLSSQVADTPYTRKDITEGDDSSEYLRTYGNEIADIITRHSVGNTENELDIFNRAIQTGEAAEFAKLTNIKNAYSGMLTDTLEVAAPAALESEHLALVNGFQAIRNDVAAMETAKSDPLNTLLRVKSYTADSGALHDALSSIYLYLYGIGVRYGNDEPAAIFKIEVQ